MTKVLIVDDDALTRQTLAGMLRAKGLEVAEATNGKEGLAAAVTGKPALVVTDVRMPEMDGLQMVEELRKDPAGKDIPVIVLSNDEKTDTLNQALESGVTVYLSKNADVGGLHEQISTALGHASEPADSDQTAEPQK